MKIANKSRFIVSIVIILMALSLVVMSVRILAIKERHDTSVMIAGVYEEDNKELKEIYNTTKEELEVLEEVKIPLLQKEIERKDKEINEKLKEIREMEIKNNKMRQNKEKVSRGENKEQVNNKEQNTPKGTQEVYFEITMYTNEQGSFPKDSPHYGTMANQEKTHWGAVAAPRNIPFGTGIKITESVPGWEHLKDENFVVKDRGGDIITKEKNGVKVYCIDIYTPDLSLAKEWGRRTVKGKIIN